MRKILLLVSASMVSAVGLCGFFGVRHAMAKSTAEAQTKAVAAAATEFLNSLSAEQRAKVQFAFLPQKAATAAKFARKFQPGGNGMDGKGPGGPPPQGPSGASPHVGGPGMGPMGGFVGEKYGESVWSNYPVSDVPRPGLQLGSLTAAQRDAAMRLLQLALSSKGYHKVLEIMGADQVLSATEGSHFAAGRDVYTIGVFGTPSMTAPWMLQFGGHHLGVNVTVDGEHGVMTPTMTGAQPAVYTENGKTVRALAAENDKAFALLDALDNAQKKQAILNYRVDDLVLGPGRAGQVIQPEGLKASAMSAHQRELLLDVIEEWAGIVNDAYAAPRMEEIKAGLNDTYFAWSGPTTHEPGRNGSSYYRIQGPKVVIEFSPQGVGGDSTMHVHTVYRDPTNDYGVQFTAGQ